MGAIKSVNDSPFHFVWRNVKKTYCSLPGKLATIMAAIVNPRKASKETSRLAGVIIKNVKSLFR